MNMDAPVVLESVSAPNTWDINSNSQPSININNTINGHKGFPFDDSDFDNRDRGSFHSQLDDLARRHPELAEHLNFDNKFPFGSNTWGHNRRGSLFTDDNSEPRSFRQSSRFRSPLSAAFDKEFNFPFNKEFQENEPATSQVPDPEPEPKPNQAEKPPQATTTNERSRKPNPNVPQSNTVDLGQKQEPVKDTREQRSMSAPPENRAGQQRFVSSINIPVQGENDVNGAQSQPQPPKPQQHSTNERVIPIHVEGRDEPVLPKNANHSFSQPQPHSDRTFNQRPSGFGGNAWNRDIPYYTGESHEPQMHRDDPHFFYENPHRNEGFTNTGPFKQQKPPAGPQYTQHPPQQPQQPPQSQQPAQQAPPPPPQQQAPPPPNVKLGPLDQIQRIQKDVLDLMNQVEKFNGKPKDKECIYLDEMLTRNLLKLDDVDTEGKESIRNSRKEAIKCIQKCISILEAKANANELLHNHLIGVPDPPLTTLEVSGVSRSGTEASIKQEESVVPEEQLPSTEPENKEATPMEINQLEPTPILDNPPVVPEQTEPIKPENIADTEMATVPSNPETVASEATKEQPMEVEAVKEKKDKKKVKKKVDKTEKS